MARHTTGDQLLPKPDGHVKLGGAKHLVHRADGPIGTVRWPGQEPQGPGATHQEVWRVQGGSDEAWREHKAAGQSEGELLKAAARALAPEAAKAIVGAVACATQQEADKRAGVRWDPKE